MSVKKYSIILLGAIIFGLYFWSRFLRSRLSKKLPLTLNVLGFLTLLYICCIFLYIIISLIKPREKSIVIEQIVDWFFTPIMEFDRYLKSFNFIEKQYTSFITKFAPILEYIIFKTDLFFIISWLVPRLILMTALFIDVFIYHQLHYKYQVILFGLLLFFNRYLRYSLKDFKFNLQQHLMLNIKGVLTNYYPNTHPAELAEDYDPEGEDEDDYQPTMFLPLDVFIKFQTESIVYRNVTNKCDISPSSFWYNIFAQKYSHLTFESNEFIDSYCNEKNIDLVPKTDLLVKISVLIEYYTFSTTNNDIKYIKILIYLNYLLCWLFILIISVPTLNIYDFNEMLFNTWKNIIEPFSGCIL